MKKIRGKVIRGENIGYKQGYPTANLSPRVLEGIRLSPGVYIAETKFRKIQYKSILVIGVPWLRKNTKAKKVEVYLLDFKGKIYRRYLVVTVLKKIRPLVFYRNQKKLLQRIRMDVKYTRNYFRSAK